MRGPVFFSSGRGGRPRGKGFFSLVPNVFSSCSHGVPKFFSKTFPIAPQIYPIWFAQSSTLMHINWKGGQASLLLFCDLGVQRGACIVSAPVFQKNWWWTNQRGFLKPFSPPFLGALFYWHLASFPHMAPSKKKGKCCEHTHDELI
jgi:hypothetical protein